MADITKLATQKITKPNIEDVMPHYLDGDILKQALEFIAYLRANKMKPSWTLHNAWKGVNKGKILYYIRLPVYASHFYRPNQPNARNWERSWCVTPYLTNIAKYEHQITDDFHRKLILQNLYGCKPHCPETQCWSNQTITVLGQDLHRFCGGTLNNRSLWIVNPDDTEMEAIKKLMEMEKRARC